MATMAVLLIAIDCVLIFVLINRKENSPLVKTLLFFCVSIFLREGFTITSTNLEFMVRDQSLMKWLTLVLYGVGFHPLFISIIVLVARQMSNLYKFLLLASLVVVSTCLDGMWNWLGYIHFIHWNLYFSAIRYAIVVVLASIVLIFLEKKVGKT